MRLPFDKPEVSFARQNSFAHLDFVRFTVRVYSLLITPLFYLNHMNGVLSATVDIRVQVNLELCEVRTDGGGLSSQSDGLSVAPG